MATKEKNEDPFDDVRIGHIVAAIWRNVSDKGVRFNVKFSRLYRNDGDWKRSGSFGRDDLLLLAKVADNAKRLNPRLKLLGHLITRSDARLLVHQSYEKKLRHVYGPAVFDVVVPEASAFKVALACREPVTRYSPKSKAAQVMHRLGEEIERRIVGRTARREVA